jgi:choloylglycine hydrolase
MNEKGLSFEYLYLPGETTYQTIPTGKENQAVAYLQFGDWVLSNFSSIAEVRAALSSIYIYKFTNPALKNIVFPLHAAIFDSTGKGIVVEFINGQVIVSDHVGVMTNSPTYSWHVTNLRNYLNLSPYSPKPVTDGGITYSATSSGAGMVGLPGDISSPSRFVKTAFLLQVAYQAKDAAEALNLAQHIINNVDIPAGLALSKDNGKIDAETTQWAVFKDLTHKVLSYRTYGDLTIHTVDMSKLDLSEKAPRLKMPLADKAFVINETDNFIKSGK